MLSHTCKECCKHLVFSEPYIIINGPKKNSFFSRRPTVLMLCLDSTLLMWLKVSPTNSKNATEAGSYLHCGGALIGRLRAWKICSSLSPLSWRVWCRNFNSCSRLLESYSALALWTRAESKVSLFTGLWWKVALSHRLVWISFLYTQCPKKPSGLL
jgi:hypothetical protein